MPNVRVSLSVTFTTPPSVGAGGTGGTLADKVVTRNARGAFILPASQVRGKLRHACEQLLRARGVPLCQPPQPERMCPHAEGVKSPCLLCRIFGAPGRPSLLRFHDLTVRDADLLPEETLRPMVSLNRHRRTAEEQRLFLIETAPHFNGLTFENPEAITGQVRDERYVHVLLGGLKMLFAWGGGTSRGLGWGAVKAVAQVDGKTVEKFSREEVEQLCQSFKSS
ncbi:MAG: RAMP superfamily CRISPR-associated protein [Abditibacteriales bacterium]|nr:RAMP superfamily CRISPR-associated protein [Abditibacteriales bacterium]MDW8367661.1 RAMP superfamily CRISPR-associated protein [Abditibacteriales bacterium]